MNGTGDTYDFWLKAAKEFGFPALVTVALLWGGWILSDRFVDAHIDTLHVMKDSIIQQSRNTSELVKANEIRLVMLTKLLEEQQKTTHEQQRTSELLFQLLETQRDKTE